MQVIVGLIAALLVASALITPRTGLRERGETSKGISNCRQIITALRIYSSDHDGKYPDAFLQNTSNANEVFRELFKAGVLEGSDAESMFGCAVSPFVPDFNIGEAPEFKLAVEAGENHWAMTKGVNDRDPGSIPLVYENPAVATWSPKWNVDAKETKTRGRAWRNGIIIGMNDSSVGIQPLASKTGTAVPMKDLGSGSDQNLFSQYDDKAPAGGWVILDVKAKR
ncbi:hypothetical protein G5S37_13900 [Roseimicrobium sp. ORNL1]|nr:hypothetical protein G5S37_13900 [Roseimicrobium sp. ORNL1]